MTDAVLSSNHCQSTSSVLTSKRQKILAENPDDDEGLNAAESTVQYKYLYQCIKYDENVHERRLKALLGCKSVRADLNIDEFAVDADESVVRQGYKFAHILAVNLQSSMVGLVVKQCINSLVRDHYPQDFQQHASIDLVPSTVERYIEDLADDVKFQLLDAAHNFDYYSLALDNIHINDTDYLVVFIRGVDSNLQIWEEMLDIIPMNKNAKASNIIASVQKMLDSVGLPWNKLVSLTTNGTSVMIESANDLVAQLRNTLEELGVISSVVLIHSIIHLQDLLSKHIELANVMTVVTKTINEITSNVHAHQFSLLLEECSDENGLPWISNSKLLNHFFELREDIASFMEQIDKPVPELRDGKWNCHLAFLADITEYLNALNSSIQIKGKLVTEIYEHLKSFKLKLALWEYQFSSRNLVHFSKLFTVSQQLTSEVLEGYILILSELCQEFDLKLQCIGNLENRFKIFTSPYSIDVKRASHNLQLELLDLKCDQKLEGKLERSKSLYDFYQNFPKAKFPRLYQQAAQILCMFGSTYICEQVSSLLKVNKSSQRSLKHVVRLCIAQSFHPNIDNLVKRKKFKKPKRI